MFCIFFLQKAYLMLLWICVSRTMVSQLVKHERIETTVAKVIFFVLFSFSEL